MSQGAEKPASPRAPPLTPDPRTLGRLGMRAVPGLVVINPRQPGPNSRLAELGDRRGPAHAHAGLAGCSAPRSLIPRSPQVASSSTQQPWGPPPCPPEGGASSLRAWSRLVQSVFGDPRLQKGGFWREEAKGSEQAGPGNVLRPWPARARGLTCSLLPAAGTVSVGASSCLSLSQHPSPTSAFRHHYVPYFRGKARSGCGWCRACVSRVCVAAWPVQPVSPTPPPLCVPHPRSVSHASSSVPVAV